MTVEEAKILESVKQGVICDSCSEQERNILAVLRKKGLVKIEFSFRKNPCWD